MENNGDVLTDIEDGDFDLLTPIQRYRTGSTLSVSDISSQAWCEMQTGSGLVMKSWLSSDSVQYRRKTTRTMKLGSKRHREMELEVHDIREIIIVTPEDFWACRMVNMLIGIEELLTTGRTRELHVFGNLNPLRYLLQESNDDQIWAIGIIDHIEMCRPSADDQERDEGLIPFLIDNKTRSVASVPGFAQKRTSRMQMMLYKFLFDNLVSNQSSEWIEQFLRARNLNPMATITSPDLITELARYDLNGKGLIDICIAAVNSFQAVSRSSFTLKVIYEHQGTSAHLGEDVWRYDHDHLQCDAGYFIEFWTGRRGPKPVLSGEAWKCQSCQYRSICSQSPYEIRFDPLKERPQT